jgi:large subunit ribosomal protein L18
MSDERQVRQVRQQPEEQSNKPEFEINKLIMKKQNRVIRHNGIRKHLAGLPDRPRLAVFRSSQHIYAQIIDDGKHTTLVAESDLKVSVKSSKKERAMSVGESIAKKALAKKIKKVVFDRGGFKYHGRVAALAEGARKGGLEF